MKKGLQARLGLFAVLVMVVLGCETLGSIITHLSPSPDGRLLGVLIQDRLYCVDLGSGEWREYETPPFTERRLTWSPESTSIVFASDTQGWDLYRLDLEAGTVETLAPHPAKDCWPLCGPRGEYIYFVSHRGLKPDIWRLEVATGACQPLTDDDSREELLSVSRDGRLLAFAACGPSPSSPGRSTSSIWTLTLQTGERSCAARNLQEVTDLSLAPNGRRLAVASQNGLSTFAFVDGRWQEEEALGPAEACAWSPDSTSLVWVHEGRLFGRKVGGRAKTKEMFEGAANLASPVWTTDGRFALAGLAPVAMGCGDPIVMVEAGRLDGSSSAPERWLVPPEECWNVVRAFYGMNENPAGMVRAFEVQLAEDPEHPERGFLGSEVCRAHARAGRLAAALKRRRELALDSVSEAELRAVYGMEHLLPRDLWTALEYFERLVSQACSEEGSAEALQTYSLELRKCHLLAAARLFRKQRYTEALRYCERANDSLVSGHMALFFLENFALARAHFEEFQRTYTAENAKEVLGHLERLRPREFRGLADTEVYLDRLFVLQNCPDGALRHYLRAHEHLRSGRPDEARKEMRWFEASVPHLAGQEEMAQQLARFDARVQSAKARVVLERALRDIEQVRASKALRRLDELEGQELSGHLVALFDVVMALDRAGRTDEANDFLASIRLSETCSQALWRAWAEPGERPFKDTFLGHLLLSVEPEVILNCKLDEVPQWMVERASALAETRRQAEDYEAWRLIARVAAARNVEGLEELLNWAREQEENELASEGDVGEVEDVVEPVLLLLGNLYQNHGQLARAVDRYAELSFSPWPSEAGSEPEELFQCLREELKRDPLCVRLWMDAERALGRSRILRGWPFRDQMCRLGQDPRWKDLPDKLEAQALSKYRTLTSELLGSPLASAALYRLGEYEKVVREHPPTAPFWGDALDEFVAGFSRDGTYWLAAKKCEALKEQLPEGAASRLDREITRLLDECLGQSEETEQDEVGQAVSPEPDE